MLVKAYNQNAYSKTTSFKVRNETGGCVVKPKVAVMIIVISYTGNWGEPERAPQGQLNGDFWCIYVWLFLHGIYIIIIMV